MQTTKANCVGLKQEEVAISHELMKCSKEPNFVGDEKPMGVAFA